ncbi:MAG: disulfide bond formation protein B [Planktotalea sp.]|uniref:disulfide bond formation protein B n=1 Tax=Planktotalea sp. TaxID=2029877 RepID=UPI0005952313|nr:disulfide bond formation protein B [Planktotalea sp.]MDG1076275.1 disulfide bond formation protein B [Planktotalea sp.]MDG1085177.1 disulfide bond formation protein B [Planktotalea sp.]
MTRSFAILIAAGGSAVLMLGALGFQYIGDMPPCKLCYWQRYPHLGAIVIGVLALAITGRLFPVLGALAALATAAIGGYHTGVERGWWEGPTSCTSSPIGDLSTEDLMAQIMSAPLVRCDDVPWELFTLSMASWNMLASLALFALWCMAIKRS